METSGDPASESDRFYSPLQASDEIRLLELQPAWKGPIRCRIRHKNFSDKPQYEALSYQWGPKEPVRYIFLDGKKFVVRENLWQALGHMRSRFTPRRLWIDAICINQLDHQERNFQVTQMGRIYKQASRVVVWLGKETQDSKLAIRTLGKLDERHYIKRHEEYRCFGERDDEKTIQSTNRKFESIYALLTVDYWKRLWIIQEVLMASECLIQSGSSGCRSKELSIFIEWISSHMKDFQDGRQSTSLQARYQIMERIDSSFPARLFLRQTSPDKMYSILRGYNIANSNARPLFSLFVDYGHAECEDQRDRIFGILGLATPCCRAAIPVDYSLCWSKILGRLVEHQILNHHSIPRSFKSHDHAWTVSQLRTFYLDAARSPSLRRPSMETIDELETFVKSFENWREDQEIQVAGHLRGRVLYISPALTTDFSQECQPLPTLSPMLHHHLNYMCRERPEISREHGLVATVASMFRNYIFDISPRYWSEKAIAHTRAREPALRLEEATKVLNFETLLKAAHKACPNDARIRLGLEENGLVFFAHRTTRVGDLVCQFAGSDVLAVLGCYNFERNEHLEKVRITRAVNFLAGPQAKAADINGHEMELSEREVNKPTGTPAALRFGLAVEAMRVLTRAPMRSFESRNLKKRASDQIST